MNNLRIFLYKLLNKNTLTLKGKLTDDELSVIIKEYIKHNKMYLLECKHIINIIIDYPLSCIVVYNFHKLSIKKMKLLLTINECRTYYTNDLFWNLLSYEKYNYLFKLKERFNSIFDCAKCKEPFNYKGKTIVDYSDSPFRNFRTDGDKDFLVDAMRAKKGPAFDDFREAINNGSIFAIITARGHNPNTIKEAIYNYIIEGFNGIDKDELIKNLKKYRSFIGEDEMTDEELIKSYLELNKYHPVSFGDDKGAVNPEEAKVEAMETFVNYIKAMAAVLNKKAFLKKDISNKFNPENLSIGFSDDDPKNIEVMQKHFKNKPDNIVKTYSTAGGFKQEVK
jgi:hypothetical protein